MSTPNSGLGRGLDALLPDADEGVTEVAIGKVVADPNQPRQTFHDTELSELAQSIRQHGLLQPLVVSPADDGYQLIAGERRLRAAKLAGLSNVPVVIRSVEDQQRFELALIENLQRSDLSPGEEARAYARLMSEGGETQEQLAKRLGKSRSRIAQLVRILKLSAEMQAALERGEITTGHAQALLAAEEGAERDRLFTAILERKLSVREAERQAAGGSAGPARNKAAADTPDWLRQLELELGQPVERKGTNQRGSLVIKYDSGEQLEAIVKRLSNRD
jgi:ParB family chromosome partitioning protein